MSTSILRGHRVHIGGSAGKSVDLGCLSAAHRLVRRLTSAILASGGSLTCFATSEPRLIEADPASALTFDWTVMEETDRFLRSCHQVGIRPVIVTSQKAVSGGIPDSRHKLFVRIQEFSDLVVLDDEEYTGGSIRDSIVARSDVLVVVSGGKGVTDLYRRMRRKEGPVFPIELGLGASCDDGRGAKALAEKAVVEPDHFFPRTADRFRGLLIGSQKLEQLDQESFVSDLLTLVSDELELTSSSFSQGRVTMNDDAVDIAVVSIIPEEYHAVCAALDNPPLVQGSTEQTNAYAWRMATISNPAYDSPFRVIVALCGEPCGSPASNVVGRTIDKWSPRYVLVVGIAGGLTTAKVRLGDVVVSTEILAYEYGKLERLFRPRNNFTYRCDRALLRAAQGISGGFTLKNLGTAPPSPTTPKVVFGSVASGDKVVDNLSHPSFRPVVSAWQDSLVAVEMEGAGAANAIENRQAEGTRVGFLMIRGISDLPKYEQTNSYCLASDVRDTWKPFAAAAAAGFAVHLIRTGWPVPPSSSYSAKVAT